MVNIVRCVTLSPLAVRKLKQPLKLDHSNYEGSCGPHIPDLNFLLLLILFFFSDFLFDDEFTPGILRVGLLKCFSNKKEEKKKKKKDKHKMAQVRPIGGGSWVDMSQWVQAFLT